jgi:hypothetical protein
VNLVAMALPNGRDRSRAELFEDEKRRIIDSCFSKKDEDGSGKNPALQPCRHGFTTMTVAVAFAMRN